MRTNPGTAIVRSGVPPFRTLPDTTVARLVKPILFPETGVGSHSPPPAFENDVDLPKQRLGYLKMKKAITAFLGWTLKNGDGTSLVCPCHRLGPGKKLA